MSYAREYPLFQAVAMSFPSIKAELVSLKFSNPVKTAGLVKLRILTPGYAFFQTSQTAVSEKDGSTHYVWDDAAVAKKVFEIPFKTTEFGLWVMMPSKPRKQKTDNGEWIPVTDVYGKVQYKNTMTLTGHNGSYRLQSLKTMIMAAIEVKAGRFKYHTPSQDDYFYAFRRLNPDEEQTESGFVGVKKEKVEPLRAQGFKVQTKTSIKSCSNCSNCFWIPQNDAGYGLPSISIGELRDYGPQSPRRMCMVHKEILDVEACDEVNDMSVGDYTDLVSQNGYRIPVGANEVAIQSFQYGERKNIVKSWLEDSEEDEDAEPKREYETEEYEGSFRTKITHDDMIALLLQDRAENCAMWTRANPKDGFYESAKVDKAGVFGLADGEWEFLPTDKAARKAGKDFKFAIRYHGIELTYVKKSPLERQWEFLDEFDEWVNGLVDFAVNFDMENVEKMLVKFETEKPAKTIRDRWLLSANTFVKEVWPLAANDVIPKERLEALLGKLVTL